MIPKTSSLGLPENLLPLSTGESRFEEWAKGASLREARHLATPVAHSDNILTADEQDGLHQLRGPRSGWREYVEQRWALLASLLMGDDVYAQLHIGGVYFDEGDDAVAPWRNGAGPYLFVPKSWENLFEHPDRRFEVLQLICGMQLVRRWTRFGVRIEKIALSQLRNFGWLWERPFKRLAPQVDRVAHVLGYFLALYLAPARVEEGRVMVPDSTDWVNKRFGLIERIVRGFARGGREPDAPAYAWEADRLVTLWDSFPVVGGNDGKPGMMPDAVFPLEVIERWEQGDSTRPVDSLAGVLALMESVAHGQVSARRWASRFGVSGLTDEEYQALRGLATPWSGQLLGAVSIWRRIGTDNDVESIVRWAFSWVFRLLDMVPWREPLATSRVNSLYRWEPPRAHQMLGLVEPVIRLMAGEDSPRSF
jgi:hypothetical protein